MYRRVSSASAVQASVSEPPRHRWATRREGCSEAVGTQVKLVNTGRAGETCPGWQGVTRLHFCNNVSTLSRAAMLLRI